MKSERVTRTWEFYRDNCDGLKEPMRKELRELDGYVSSIEAENAKLVDVLHEVEAEAVHAYRCLQQDCETIANSSEHFFKKWWHAECECDRLKAENAKLRELVKDMWGAYCFGNGGCGDTWLTDEQDMAVRHKVRELGIEANDD